MMEYDFFLLASQLLHLGSCCLIVQIDRYLLLHFQCSHLQQFWNHQKFDLFLVQVAFLLPFRFHELILSSQYMERQFLYKLLIFRTFHQIRNCRIHLGLYHLLVVCEEQIWCVDQRYILLLDVLRASIDL